MTDRGRVVPSIEGQRKIGFWLQIGTGVAVLVVAGWTAAKFDSRLESVETKIVDYEADKSLARETFDLLRRYKETLEVMAKKGG